MCTQRHPYNWADELYERHKETIEQYLTNNALPALREKSQQACTIFLKELQRRWEDHRIMNKWLRKCFEYLDRYFVMRRNLPTLDEVALQCFRSKIFDEMRKEVTTAIVCVINEEREGTIIDKSLIKQILEIYDMMVMNTLEDYYVELEEEILKGTREYYRTKCDSWTHESTQEYLMKAECAINNERQRGTDYLNTSITTKILKVLGDVFLEDVKPTLLGNGSLGFRSLLCHDKADEIQLIFRVFRRLENCLAPFGEIFQDFIISVGIELVSLR
jgi:cullin 1